MKIRKAKETDILDILQSVKRIVGYHCAIDKIYKPYKKYRDLKKYFKNIIHAKNNIVLVVEDDGKLVGFLEGGIEKASNDMMIEKIGVVNNLFVEEKYRNKKIGQKLLTYALKYFKSKNIKYIQISADVRNNSGRNFWKKNKFFEYRIEMLRKLK